ncbi:MAG: YiaA/YiaB family inner membrane protein [Cyanobacteria bacterium P01_A01_bin.114]
MKEISNNSLHSSGWILQCWISFVVSLFATTMGLIYMPMNAWSRGYMAVSVLFTVSSTISISKTTRDQHESRKIIAKVDEARVERLLADHHPLK